MAASLVTLLVIVEEEKDFALLAEQLRAGDTPRYEPTWCRSVLEGMEEITRHKYDVVLIQWHLGMPGARNPVGSIEEQWGDIPVILLADAPGGQEDFLTECAGAVDCLTKEELTRWQLERAIRYAMRQAVTLQALRRSRRQLELFMWQVPCAVCICDSRGTILFQNSLSGEHFTAADLRRWMPPEGGGVPEVHVSNGRHWLVSTFPMIGSDKARLLGVAGTDITSRIQSESELKRTSRLLNAILGNLSVMAGRLGSDGRVMEMRGRGLAEVGLTEEELAGVSLVEQCPVVRAGFEQALRGTPTTVVWHKEHRGRRHYFENYLHADAEHGGVLSLAVNVTARIEAEADRNRQSRLLSDVLRKMPLIVGQLDSAGRVVAVEGEGVVRPGFRREDLLGRKFAEVHPATRAALKQALAGEEVNFILQGEGEENTWYVDTHFVPYDGGGATFYGRDISERRWLERRLLMASDLEQRRIGADLHDGLGQKLTGLACLATAVRERTIRLDPETAAQADMVAKLANEAVQQARALARGLCLIDLGDGSLVTALAGLVEQIKVLHGIEGVLDVPAESPACEHLILVHLYRITQEAITNAIRHGGARRIRVALERDGAQHRLIISDNGDGFYFDDEVMRRSNGLRLMKFRATTIGGLLLVTSRLGQGTTVCCEFSAPVAAANPAACSMATAGGATAGA